jgi:hypothetical protein
VGNSAFHATRCVEHTAARPSSVALVIGDADLTSISHRIKDCLCQTGCASSRRRVSRPPLTKAIKNNAGGARNLIKLSNNRLDFRASVLFAFLRIR